MFIYYSVAFLLLFLGLSLMLQRKHFFDIIIGYQLIISSIIVFMISNNSLLETTSPFVQIFLLVLCALEILSVSAFLVFMVRFVHQEDTFNMKALIVLEHHDTL